jgi:hypothetical protein
MSDALDDLVLDIEDGLTVWPDGLDTGLGPTGEVYRSFAIGYIIGSKFTDADLIERLRRELRFYKRSATNISWRVRPTFFNAERNAGDTAATDPFPCAMKDVGARIAVLEHDVPVRYLRCRVLITRYASKAERDAVIARKVGAYHPEHAGTTEGLTP